MGKRSEFLVMARRVANLIRRGLKDAKNDAPSDEKFAEEKEMLEHHTVGFYLVGVLSYLEGRYGVRPWQNVNFDSTIASYDNKAYKEHAVSKATLEALVCIRNALVHNAGDLRQNKNQNSESMVRAAALPGVDVDGSGVVTLNPDFLETVRVCFVAVSRVNGDS